MKFLLNSPSMDTYKSIPLGSNIDIHINGLKLVREYIIPGSRVLDLGAGKGGFSLRLLDNGYEVDAADQNTSEWMVKDIPVIYLDLNHHIEDPPGPYDCIVALEVIEHLHNPHKFFDDCKRMLKPHGSLIFSTPNILNLDSRRRYFISGDFATFSPEHYSKYMHTTILPYWLIDKIIETNDFKIEKIIVYGKRPRPWPKSWLVPLINLFFLPFGLRIPIKYAFGRNVMYVLKCK